MSIKPGIKNQIVEARKVQSEYDKEMANKYAQESHTQMVQRKYDNAVKAAQAERDANKTPASRVPNMSAIPSYNIVSQGYYIGYHPDYGVVVATKVSGVYIPSQLLTKKKSVLVVEAKNEHFNDLSKDDFNAILKAKPSYEELQRAYFANPVMRTLDNVLGRMNIETAQVVF